MRKLLFIVLAFTACLLFPEGGDGACIRQQAPSAAFSAGDMHTDEWQCERTYNSDLNHQPRVLREAESCPAQPSFRYRFAISARIWGSEPNSCREAGTSSGWISMRLSVFLLL